jgi:serine/threonine protein kinase/WD40 repeat protein/Flp pilus assembly protein TadD
MVDQPSQVRDPVEVLAEEFLERRRRGEVPSLKEYTDRYPHLADEIREVFPALVVMDDIDPQSHELGRSLGGLHLRGRPGLRRLGDFRILREVGQGGMGIVYEARQESLGRHVALKVLPPAVSRREKYRERFQREAKAAARLHHTNIVPIFGVGEDQGVLYYAMQFIQGQALDAVLEDVKRMRNPAETEGPAEQPTLAAAGVGARSLLTGDVAAAAAVTGDAGVLPRPLPVPAPSGVETRSGLSSQPEARYYRSIAWLGVQAAEGLAHAHAQGILHRDIKPSNLLLDAQGTLWITDFGLAKVEDAEDLTHTGELIGTLRYMAPERFEGRGDARSDVYALGVTLYEMLTLRPPFTGGDRASLIGQITNDTPQPPGRLAPLLPRDLETIVQKAMAREPGARYTTARALADDLRRFLENRPIRARRTSAAERLRRWCRRNPAVASLVGAVFLLLVCLSAGAVATALRLEREGEALAAAEKERTENLYQSLVAQANASRFSSQAGQRFGTLEAVRKAAALVRERGMAAERLGELRTLAIAALALPDIRTRRELPFPRTPFHWDTDDRFRLFACNDTSGRITVYDLSDDREIARLSYLPGEAWLRFSPGGRFLLAWGSDRIRVWDLSTHPPRPILDREVADTVYRPDGRHLVLRFRDDCVSEVDLLTPRQVRPVLDGSRHPGIPLAFDPTGAKLAMLASNRVEIRDTRTWKLILRVPETQPVSAVAWHPRGNIVALVCPEPSIHVWQLTPPRRLAVLEGCRNGGLGTAFTPDGELVVSSGWEGKIRFWNWRTGQQVLRRPGGSNLRFGPDGRLVVLDQAGATLVEVATGQEYRTLVQQSSRHGNVDYGSAVVHPDGGLLAVCMTDGLHLWDLQSGDEAGLLGPNQVYSAAWAGTEALVTNGTAGLLSWPVQRPRGGATGWKIGLPRWLRPGTPGGIGCSQDGKLLVQATFDGAVGLSPDRPGQQFWLGPQADVNGVSVSPDGRWVSTHSHHDPGGIKVWDTARRAVVRELDTGALSGSLFSPDGRWLLATGRRGAWLVAVGTWRPRRLPSCMNAGFSPDGSLLGLEVVHGVVSLLDPGSCREVARLESPEQAEGGCMFTPDGTRLIASSNDARAIHVWDLRLIRQRLAEFGLDWELPPYGEPAATKPIGAVLMDVGVRAAPTAGKDAFLAPLALRSLQVALVPYHPDTYHERGHVYAARGELDKAVADFTEALRWQPPDAPRQAHLYLSRSDALMRSRREAEAAADLHKVLELTPKDPLPFNNLAYLYVNGPPELRDPKKALALARQGLRVAPGHWYCRNTLGVAHYRLGQYEPAVVALERSLRESQGERAAFQLYFLAMCYARLDDTAKAQECYDQAARWEPEHPDRLPPNWRERLKAIAAEADAVFAEKRDK